jgi:hypothetical protein
LLNSSIVSFRKLLIVCALTLTASQTFAAGALAIDSHQGGQYGFAYNAAKLEQAEHKVMQDCGSDCQVVLRFENGCAAFAEDPSGASKAYGWGALKTMPESQNRALAACQARGGKHCKVQASGCNKR